MRIWCAPRSVKTAEQINEGDSIARNFGHPRAERLAFPCRISLKFSIDYRKILQEKVWDQKYITRTISALFFVIQSQILFSKSKHEILLLVEMTNILDF